MKKFISLCTVVFLAFTLRAPTWAQPKIYTPSEVATIEKAGSYPVRISTENGEGELVEKIIMVTVTYPKTVIHNTLGEGIDGSDFRITAEEDPYKMNIEDLKRRAKVSAWRLEDGVAIPVVSATVSGAAGNYSVTFATEKGTQVTVQAVYGEVDLLKEPSFLYTYYNDEESMREQRVQFRQYFATFFGLLILFPILIIAIILYMYHKKTKEIRELLYPKEKADKNK